MLLKSTGEPTAMMTRSTAGPVGSGVGVAVGSGAGAGASGVVPDGAGGLVGVGVAVGSSPSHAAPNKASSMLSATTMSKRVWFLTVRTTPPLSRMSVCCCETVRPR